MVKTVNYTSKEIDYQLRGDWEIDREEYDFDDNLGGGSKGGLYGAGRIGYNITDEKAHIDPEYVEDVCKARIKFDEDLMEFDSFPEDFYRIGVDLNSAIDYEGVRAFTISHNMIEEYYPAHTQYIQETDSGDHRVEFVVRIFTRLNNPLKYSQVEVGYTLHPDEQEKIMKKREMKPGYHFKYTCMLKNTEITSPHIVVYPPLNVEVIGGVVGEDDNTSFDTVREAEKWVANWYKEKSDKLGETAQKLFGS